MIVIDISFWELKALLEFSNVPGTDLFKDNDRCRMAVLFDARWQWNSGIYRESINDRLRQAEDLGFRELYRVCSDGNDAAEDFLLYSLGERQFPLLHIPESSLKSNPSLEADGGKLESVASLFRNCPAEGRVGTLFISGDRSSVGKSTSCLALLTCLIQAGIPTSDIGYIKPVTQCEELQPVVDFCTANNIECRGIGPVVFYKGFTRAYLNDETESSEELVASAVAAVREIESRRKFVLVDGVGYPSVGSICAISNAHVASALRAPVLLIGKSGVGDAVDSHNLNSVYFQYYGCHVLGGIFNKLSLNGYYSLAACREAVTLYFNKCGSGQRAYGFMPQLEDGGNAFSLAAAFSENVDVVALMSDVFTHRLKTRVGGSGSPSNPGDFSSFSSQRKEDAYPSGILHSHSIAPGSAYSASTSSSSSSSSSVENGLLLGHKRRAMPPPPPPPLTDFPPSASHSLASGVKKARMGVESAAAAAAVFASPHLPSQSTAAAAAAALPAFEAAAKKRSRDDIALEARLQGASGG